MCNKLCSQFQSKTLSDCIIITTYSPHHSRCVYTTKPPPSFSVLEAACLCTHLLLWHHHSTCMVTSSALVPVQRQAITAPKHMQSAPNPGGLRCHFFQQRHAEFASMTRSTHPELRLDVCVLLRQCSQRLLHRRHRGLSTVRLHLRHIMSSVLFLATPGDASAGATRGRQQALLPNGAMQRDYTFTTSLCSSG